MEICQQMARSLTDRLVEEYNRLNEVLELHPSEESARLRSFISERLGTIESFGADASEADVRDLKRRMKMDLRSAQRRWKRHLVTVERLKKVRRISVRDEQSVAA